MSNLSDVMTLPLQIPETIPNDWSWRNLVELCNPKQWKTISNSDLTETGYRVFGANGFIGFYHEFNHEDETISVTCRGATCGTVNLIPPRTYITGNSMCLDNLSREVSKFYLFYATQFRTFSDVISGSAQPQITAEGMKKVCLPIPPLPEQKKIASILTSVDEVIENTQKQIDKLQDLKKATMNELLTKGIGHTEFKDSELGRIPKSWEVVTLNEVTVNHDSKRVPIKSVDRQNIQGKYRYYGASGVIDYVEDYIFDGRYILLGEDGENVLSRNLPLAFIVEGKFWVNNHAHILQPTETVDIGFLCEYLESLDYKNIASGSAQPKITKSALSDIKVKLPSAGEQLKIIGVLSSIDKTIEPFRQKLSQTQSLKKSLMQDLLTGKVRVTVN